MELDIQLLTLCNKPDLKQQVSHAALTRCVDKLTS